VLEHPDKVTLVVLLLAQSLGMVEKAAVAVQVLLVKVVIAITAEMAALVCLPQLTAPQPSTQGAAVVTEIRAAMAA
jgi:hypothetical protein